MFAFGAMYSHIASTGGPNLGQLWQNASVWNELRRPFAGIIAMLFNEMRRWDDWVALWVGALVVHAAFWGAGVLIVPFIAAGETRVRTYLRAVKVMLWSSMCAWPMGWILPYAVSILERHTSEIMAMALFFAWVIWVVSVIVRLGGRYGGPKTGPRWEDRPLRCENCGYVLANLPVTGRCPECGRNCAESLPHNRRLPEFATAPSAGDAIGAFVTTFGRSLSAVTFSRGLVVSCGRQAARRFAVGSALVVGLIVAFGASPLYFDSEPRMRHLEEPWILVDWLAVPFVFGCAGMCAVFLWLLLAGVFVSRFGFAESATRGVVLCYATSFLVVPCLLFLTALWPCWYIESWLSPSSREFLTPAGGIDKHLAVCFLLFSPSVIALVLSFLRLRHMLRAVRYANA
jgi:hypothetical protein